MPFAASKTFLTKNSQSWFVRFSQTNESGQFWGKEASGCLFFCPEDRTVLLALRSHYVEQPNTWGIPGGAIKTEDSDENDNIFSEEETQGYQHVHHDLSFESAKRETEEELGVFPASFNKVDQTIFQQGGFRYTTFVLAVTAKEKAAFSKQIHLNWENTKSQWFSTTQMPINLHFGVEYLKNNNSLWRKK